jgi:DNA-binding transcriptional MerR regulator/DNA-directed RNA polymerase subunit RPC12/RpoP
MSKYTTGEIAKLCGVSVRTVQYYDTRGVLVPCELSEGGRRLYSEDDLGKMKIICFLRELDVPLDSIAKLMREENSNEVISLILEEHEKALRTEISEKKEKLKMLSELNAIVKKAESVSVESIGDVAHIMESKKQMKKLHLTLILASIPITVLEWASIILWITDGIWWPFLVYTVAAIPFGIWISRFYFKRVAYICPQCHEIFVPKFWEAFFANHTPTTRKLSCPHCSYKGFCVETYRKEQK